LPASARDLASAVAAYERGPACPIDDIADEPLRRGVLENNFGTALLMRGDLNRAIDHFGNAVGANAAYAQAHSNLGVALASRGQPAEAKEHLRTALRLDPNDTETRAGSAHPRRGFPRRARGDRSTVRGALT
jgi:Flp pilus assembly protein TadD